MSSPTVMYEVVKRLGLNVSYSQPGVFYPKLIYGSNQPITISFPDAEESASASLKATVYKNGKLVLSDFFDGKVDSNGNPVATKPVTIANYNKIDTIDTPVGRITVAPNRFVQG